MQKPQPIELKRIAADAPAVEQLLAALRRKGSQRWVSRFAASGGKPVTPAPARRMR